MKGQQEPTASGQQTSTASDTTHQDLLTPKSPTLAQTLLGVVLAIVAGVALVSQNGINTNLRKHVVSTDFLSAAVSFSVGFVAISIVASVHAPRCHGTSVLKAPWYAFTGGLLGPTYVIAAIILSQRLGFSTFQLCAIAGQLAVGLASDAVGFLGLPKRRPTAMRVLAVIGVVAGAALSSSDFETDATWWEWLSYCGATFLGGGTLPIIGCVNGVMQKYALTYFRAVVVSFAGGSSIMVLAAVAAASLSGDTLEIRPGEPWMWTGGICGVVLGTCNAVGIGILGAAAYVTLFLSAQLTAAFTFDTIGAFGFDAVEPSPQRVCGFLLAILAAITYQLQPVLAARSSRASGPEHVSTNEDFAESSSASSTLAVEGKSIDAHCLSEDATDAVEVEAQV